MGIWVVILEAVATEGDRVGLGPEPGALEDLAEELAGHYAVVSERRGAYETELWVEEGTAGGAVLAAQFLWQAAVRYLGLPAWEVVRAEARDAHALEIGIIDWPVPPAGPDDPDTDELAPPDLATISPAPVQPSQRKPAAKNAAKKAVAKTVGAKTVGAKTVGAKTVGAKTVGAKTVGAKTVGAKTVGARKSGAKKAVARKSRNSRR